MNRDKVRIPGWVQDLASFRRWAYSDEFPETGRICYLNGDVWVDLSREQLFTHNQVKVEFSYTLANVLKTERTGRFFPDGARLTNVEADLSCEPDGVFVSHDSLQAGRVRLVEGGTDGYLELEGTPDMVLEVVSDSSVEKDTVTLRDLYWRAGIPEYWRADARGKELAFDILRHTAKGYAVARKQKGWVKSAVLGKAFQLTQQPDALGNPEYTLAVR
jgi:Uma2 family endonuclease